MSIAIWWIRRDLRLFDNPALDAARRQARHVIPLWILDPALLQSPYVGQKRLAFLLQSLRRLQDDLQERGSDLIVCSGDPLPELQDVPNEYVHEPWRTPPDVQQAAGCRIDGDYPAPIVDHQKARERALATFKDVG